MRSNLAILLGTLLLFISIVAAAMLGYSLSLLLQGLLTTNPQLVVGVLFLFLTLILLICVLYALIKRQRALALRRMTAPPPTILQPSPWEKDTPLPPSSTPVNRDLQNQLYRMLNGDQEEADRLVNRAKRKYPRMLEDWYWEKVIADLERDRQ